MSFRSRHSIPDLGVGVGFRVPHYEHIFAHTPAMDWFEVISENHFTAPKSIANLEKLHARYRVIPHGVSLSIGSSDPLDDDYLAHLKNLATRLKAPWCSDHLCWTGVAGIDSHDLLPLPYTEQVIRHVVERAKRVQGTLEVPFVLENVSSYLTFNASTMPEWEFVSEIAERADIGILLDCNNIFVSAMNHGFDPMAFINAVPADRVVQIHLAGHTDKGSHLLDTHSDHVRDEVWELYRRALARVGSTSTLIEWDEDIPTWDLLSAEAEKARGVRDDVFRSMNPKKEALWPSVTS